jgi:hypothetical protein
MENLGSNSCYCCIRHYACYLLILRVALLRCSCHTQHAISYVRHVAPEHFITLYTWQLCFVRNTRIIQLINKETSNVSYFLTFLTWIARNPLWRIVQRQNSVTVITTLDFLYSSPRAAVGNNIQSILWNIQSIVWNILLTSRKFRRSFGCA